MYDRQLNAWDRRQIDEPDLTKRMDAFSEAGKLLTSDEPLDVEFLLMLVHNCTFLLATVCSVLMCNVGSAICNFQISIIREKFICQHS
jgi:hypothetical protein